MYNVKHFVSPYIGNEIVAKVESVEAGLEFLRKRHRATTELCVEADDDHPGCYDVAVFTPGDLFIYAIEKE